MSIISFLDFDPFNIPLLRLLRSEEDFLFEIPDQSSFLKFTPCSPGRKLHFSLCETIDAENVSKKSLRGFLTVRQSVNRDSQLAGGTHTVTVTYVSIDAALRNQMVNS